MRFEMYKAASIVNIICYPFLIFADWRLCFITSLLFSTCQSPSIEKAPWIGLDWLNKSPTTIDIQNTSLSPEPITLSYFNHASREDFKKDTLLDTNHSFSTVLSIFRPELIKIECKGKQYEFHLIPDRMLSIQINDTLTFVGENASIYEASLKFKASVYSGTSSEFEARKKVIQQLGSIKNYPKWLMSYFSNANKYDRLYRIYQRAGYQQFSGYTNISVPTQDSLEAEVLLTNVQQGHYHNYFSDLLVFKSNFDFVNKPNFVKSKDDLFLRRKNIIQKLLEIKEERIRYSLLSLFLEGNIRKRKAYYKKDSINNYIVSLLPIAHAEKINDIQKEYNSIQISEDYKKILNEPLTGIKNLEAPLNSAQDHFKLLKFWFAGCAPCKKQIPYENALLEKYGNLSLIHFCYATSKEEWESYTQKNGSKGQHFYLDEIAYKQFKKTFDLNYAPRYILLNPQNQIVCWHCANPNQEEINVFLE